MNYSQESINVKDSKKYEYKVQDKLKEFGIKITINDYWEDQFNYGDSIEGYEIKYDKLSTQTKRLWIEVAEKSNPKNAQWIPSGIFAQNTSKFFIIGNDKYFWLFNIEEFKKYLMNKYKIKKDENLYYKLLPLSNQNSTETSRGFLVEENELDERHTIKIVF